MLGTHAKKPLSLALSELDKENAARFAFEYFARVSRHYPSLPYRLSTLFIFFFRFCA